MNYSLRQKLLALSLSQRQKLLAWLLLCVITATAADHEPRMRSCRPLGSHHTAALTRGTAASRANLYVGDRHQLLVLVAFNDCGFKESNPLSLWERVFNEKGFNESDFHGSVSDYFYDQSYGKFNLIFDVYYVKLADGRDKYHSTDYADDNSKYLVQDVVDSLRLREVDWKKYDWAGDGNVSQLLMLYAGRGMNDGGGDETIWPHQSSMTDHEVEPIEVTCGDDSKVKVDKYCCVQELTGSDTYGTFGTICHEYSHCFGLPDFYYGSSKVVYSWDIMDYGIYNNGGFCPPGYSAHERMFMGWLTPVELSDADDISHVEPLSEQPQAYLIRNDGYADEYYIVENRQKEGWDSSLPGSGLLVYHIDYDEEVWLTSMPNSSIYKRYTIFPANNKTYTSYVSGWAYPYQGNDSLTNYSSPKASLLNANSDGEQLMSKPITNMKITGRLASFSFMGGSQTAITTLRADSESYSVLYDVGPLLIVRDATGTIKKVMKR